jgi:hypothetical protein
MSDGILNSANIEEANRGTATLASNLNSAAAAQAKLTSEEEKQLKVIREALKDKRSLTQEEEKYHDSVKKTLSAERKRADYVERTNRRMERFLKEAPELVGDLDKSFALAGNKLEKSVNAELEKMLKDLDKALELGTEIKKVDLFNIDDLKKAQKVIKGINDDLSKFDDRTFGKGMLKRSAQMKGVLGGVRSGWKDRTGNGWRESGEYLKKMGANRIAAKGGSSIAGSAASMMGGAMAGAAKFVPVAGAVVSAVSAINDAINAADRIAKGAHKDYKALAGPIFQGGKFEGDSRRYNKEIRNVSRNLDLGVDYEEWNAMFESMKGAGMTLQGVEKNFGSFGDTMESVQQTSVMLGTSLEVTGDYFAKQSQMTRSGLKTMEKGFLEVARGAKVAGMETNKFYDYVLQTTNAMALYGDYTAAAAVAVKKGASNATTSQEKGAQAATDIASWLGKMDNSTAMNIGAFVNKSGANANDIADNLASKFAEKMASLQEGSQEWLKYSNLKKDVESVKASTGNNALKLGMLARMSSTEVGPSMLIQAVKQLTGAGNKDLLSMMRSGNTGMMLQKVEALGLPREIMDQLTQMMKGAGTSGDVFAKHLQPLFDKILKIEDEGERKKQIQELQNIADILKKGEAASTEQMDIAAAFMSKQGISREFFMNEAVKDAMTIGETLDASLGNLRKGKPTGFSVGAFAEKSVANLAVESRGFLPASLKPADQKSVNKLTTPLEKLTKITMDSIKFDASDSQLAKVGIAISASIRDGVGNIYDWLMHKDDMKPKKEAEAFLKSEKMTVIGQSTRALNSIVEGQDALVKRLNAIDDPTKKKEEMEKAHRRNEEAFKTAVDAIIQNTEGKDKERLSQYKSEALKKGGPVADMVSYFLDKARTTESWKSMQAKTKGTLEVLKNQKGGDFSESTLLQIADLEQTAKDLYDLQTGSKYKDPMQDRSNWEFQPPPGMVSDNGTPKLPADFGKNIPANMKLLPLGNSPTNTSTAGGKNPINITVVEDNSKEGKGTWSASTNTNLYPSTP